MFKSVKIICGHCSYKFLLVFAIIDLSCSARIQVQEKSIEPDFYTRGSGNRLAAEWEPAIGTMLTWPLCIPYKLVVELARDNHVYTLVENEAAKNEARQWYSAWGMDSTHISFIYSPQGLDAWWVRDWGPGALFTPEGQLKLADGKYIYSTPVTSIQCHDTLRFLYKTPDGQLIRTDADDRATLPLGKALNLEVLDLPFINTGGNVATDGLGTAFSTCVLLNENKFYNVAEEQFLKFNKQLLGIENYHILSNFEFNGIQHIDCFMKLLDGERILVAEPPLDHPLHPVYEGIIKNELAKLKSPYGRPYEILRIKSGRYNNDRLAAYTNALILNRVIYVPLFKIREDSLALQQWRVAMPGYTVKGFEFDLADEPIVSQKMKDHYRIYGWQDGDALHCRTRAIWDPAMLFISVHKSDPVVKPDHPNKIHIAIIDYSNRGLIKDKCLVKWRLSGKSEWNSLPLHPQGTKNHFVAEIPFHKKGSLIEYYITATSNSGKTETQPRTAPLGFYKFSIL